MSQSLATISNAIELALIQGDLSKLSADDRLAYYRKTCESLGLNPLTQPFAYITLNGKLTLYARKDCADQLRRLHGISIEAPKIDMHDDWIVVMVVARDANGRTDSDVGVVRKTDMRGDYGNALMKAVTKSKRRVTLSMCGLGMLDETEVDSIHGGVVTVREERPAVADKSPAERLQGHAKAIEEAETLDELKDAYALAFRDKHLSDNDMGRLTALKDTRKKALRTGPPTESEMSEWDRERDAVEATK